MPNGNNEKQDLCQQNILKYGLKFKFQYFEDVTREKGAHGIFRRCGYKKKYQICE